jgi:Hypoxia induced protein conserved region
MLSLSSLSAQSLLFCVWNMMRGGSANRSQMFMRWRVGLQFVAIILLVLGLWLARGHT